LIGVILSGGRSLRMGTDKGLIDDDGVPWSVRAAQKISAHCEEVCISIRPKQQEKYLTISRGLRVVLDQEARGPLSGILSVAEAFTGSELFVLAADLIEMRSETIGKLVTEASKAYDFDCVLFRTPDRIQPLCGIYRSSALGKLRVLHSENPEAGVSSLLKSLNVRAIPHPELPDFAEFNTPESRGIRIARGNVQGISEL